MPPTRRSVSSRGRTSSRGQPPARGRPASQGRPVSRGRASSVRGRTRSTAITDLPIVHFEDSAELQQLVGEAGSIGGESRFQWEESVRLRLDRTYRMMTEMHTMLQSMTARTAHMLPPVDVDSPPVASATVSVHRSWMALQQVYPPQCCNNPTMRLQAHHGRLQTPQVQVYVQVLVCQQ